MGWTGHQINCYTQDMGVIPSHILSTLGDEDFLQSYEILDFFLCPISVGYSVSLFPFVYSLGPSKEASWFHHLYNYHCCHGDKCHSHLITQHLAPSISHNLSNHNATACHRVPIPYSPLPHTPPSKWVVNALFKYVKHNPRIPFESQFLEPLLVIITVLFLIDHRKEPGGYYIIFSLQETDGILKLG